MTGINVDYINPFLMAATGIIKDICQIEMKIGKPVLLISLKKLSHPR